MPPVVLGAIAVAGAATKAIGDHQKAEGQAKADEFNASVKGQQAQQALEQAQESERINRVQSAAFIGTQKANYGASGVDASGGSAMDVLQASAQNAEMDALSIRHAGQMKAWGLQTGASEDRMAADNSRTAGNYAVAGDIMGAAEGGSKIYGAMK